MFGRRKGRAPSGSEPAFRLGADEIRDLAPEHGFCFATDRITVDGRPVGYMYREAPDEGSDSGWRFFAGDEDDSYANDPANTRIYDVNTICNYDESIVPLLDAPIGSAFERAAPGAELSLIEE